VKSATLPSNVLHVFVILHDSTQVVL
jgi:hypothetical protein